MPYRRGLMLWWDGKAGAASCDGMMVVLPRRPRVMALDIDQIQFSIGLVHEGAVQVMGEAWRPLTDEEKLYIVGALERMVKSGLDEIC